MTDWIQEQSFEGIYIKMDDGAKTPVAVVAVPMGWRENPTWKASAERKANLLTAAPKMYKALEKVLAVMNLETSEEVCLDDLYDTVKDTLKEASYEEKNVG